MAIEIEAKMRLVRIDETEERLRSLGGSFHCEIAEDNTFFDTVGNVLKASDQGLRVRVERAGEPVVETVTITHKGPRAHGKLKSRVETEARVRSLAEASDLLGALGYQRVLMFEKRRRRWLLDGCRVELDSLPLLGDFIEIEGPSESAVIAVREKLGMGGTPLIHASYISMLLTYLAEHAMQTDRITFARTPALAK